MIGRHQTALILISIVCLLAAAPLSHPISQHYFQRMRRQGQFIHIARAIVKPLICYWVTEGHLKK